jgi:hypothetical protein
MKNIKTFESFSLNEFESGYYPAGAEFNPSAPWNQGDPDTVRGTDVPSSKLKFDLIGSDYAETAILKKKDDGKLYAVYFDPGTEEFMEFMEVEREVVGRDEDGDPEYEYNWDNAEVDDDAILAYATDKSAEGIGLGLTGWEEGKVTTLDPQVAEELLSLYNFITSKMEKAGTHTSYLNKQKYQELKKLIELLTPIAEG